MRAVTEQRLFSLNADGSRTVQPTLSLSVENWFSGELAWLYQNRMCSATESDRGLRAGTRSGQLPGKRHSIPPHHSPMPASLQLPSLNSSRTAAATAVCSTVQPGRGRVADDTDRTDRLSRWSSTVDPTRQAVIRIRLLMARCARWADIRHMTCLHLALFALLSVPLLQAASPMLAVGIPCPHTLHRLQRSYSSFLSVDASQPYFAAPLRPSRPSLSSLTSSVRASMSQRRTSRKRKAAWSHEEGRAPSTWLTTRYHAHGGRTRSDTATPQFKLVRPGPRCALTATPPAVLALVCQHLPAQQILRLLRCCASLRRLADRDAAFTSVAWRRSQLTLDLRQPTVQWVLPSALCIRGKWDTLIPLWL